MNADEDHPAVKSVALMVNDHRYARKPLMPVMIARAIIAEVFAKEVTRWVEVDDSVEGGQPNGIGETEPSWYREWFSEKRETHHRQVLTFYGPWIEGSRASVREAAEKEKTK